MSSDRVRHIFWFRLSMVALLAASCCVFSAFVASADSDLHASGAPNTVAATSGDSGGASDRAPAAAPATLRVVPGLTPQDIYLNLEASGFGKHKQSTGTGNSPARPQVVVFSGEDDSMASAGVYMSYLIKTGGAAEVATVSEAAFTCVSPTREIAARYLGFCASIPYDGAQPASAQAWVQSVVIQGTAKASRNFGPAKYSVSCDSPTKGAYLLDIVPATE